MWGPVFTILFVSRHNLNESLEIIGRVFPFVKPVKNEASKAYKFFDFVLNVITTLGFFVLSVIGYKKLIENVMKKFVDTTQLVYFVICTVVAGAIIAYTLFLIVFGLYKLFTDKKYCLQEDKKTAAAQILQLPSFYFIISFSFCF